VNVLCKESIPKTFRVAGATVYDVMTAERQGWAVTVRINDVVPVGVYTMPARAIEFTCTV
jgi:hypothetical protein